MKKRLLVLGMVACLLGVTACGSADVVTEALVDQATAEGIAVDYVEGVNNIITGYGMTTAQDIMDNSDSFGMTEEEAKVIGEAVENFNIALEDLGTYQGIQSVSYTEDGKKLEVNATIVGSEIDPKGAARTAEVLIELELPKGTFKSMLTNVNYTFGEMMTTAGLNTILGICTVFMVLIILMVIISLFSLISKAEKAIANKKAGKSEPAKATSVDNAVAQIAANEEAQDDTELIAVIAAAIAASEGAASADGYVVRSIRRRY